MAPPLPSTLRVFSFPGFATQSSLGLVLVTQDRRLVLCETATNPGTSITNAMESALPAARELTGLSEEPAFQVVVGLGEPTVWAVEIRNGTAEWSRLTNWHHDEDLGGAVETLTKASGLARAA